MREGFKEEIEKLAIWSKVELIGIVQGHLKLVEVEHQF